MIPPHDHCFDSNDATMINNIPYYWKAVMIGRDEWEVTLWRSCKWQVLFFCRWIRSMASSKLRTASTEMLHLSHTL